MGAGGGEFALGATGEKTLDSTLKAALHVLKRLMFYKMHWQRFIVSDHLFDLLLLSHCGPLIYLNKTH